MYLTTNFGEEVVNPDAEAIEKAVRGLLEYPEEEFASLAVSKGSEMFIQTTSVSDDGSTLRLEYGTGDGFLYSIEELSMGEVIDFFQSFNSGDTSWRSDARWKEANTPADSSEFFGVLQGIVDESGRSLEELVGLMLKLGPLEEPADRAARRKWLREEIKFTREQASALVAYSHLIGCIQAGRSSEQSSNARPEFSKDEEMALGAFERAHKEFLREHYKEAEQQFLAIINTYPHVTEVASRARFYLEKARAHLRQKEQPRSSGRHKTSRTSSSPEHEKVHPDPYHVLGVSSSATQAEITAAFKKLAHMYHPDKVEGLAPEYLEIAKKRMVEINVAYDALTRKR